MDDLEYDPAATLRLVSDTQHWLEVARSQLLRLLSDVTAIAETRAQETIDAGHPIALATSMFSNRAASAYYKELVIDLRSHTKQLRRTYKRCDELLKPLARVQSKEDAKQVAKALEALSRVIGRFEVPQHLLLSEAGKTIDKASDVVESALGQLAANGLFPDRTEDE